MTAAGVLAPFASALAEGADALGLALPAAVQARLLAFGELLLKWNRIYNLTALRRPEEVVTHHLLDSLAVLPHLAAVERLADIGSGGGLPGIALAIARPEWAVSSIEAVNKKASFQQQAKIELRLANFTVFNARVENVGVEDAFPDLACSGAARSGVISRAFSSLADFVRLAGHLAGPSGCLYAMKGTYPADEIDTLPAGWEVRETIALAVPGLDAERHLIVLARA